MFSRDKFSNSTTTPKLNSYVKNVLRNRLQTLNLFLSLTIGISFLILNGLT